MVLQKFDEMLADHAGRSEYAYFNWLHKILFKLRADRAQYVDTTSQLPPIAASGRAPLSCGQHESSRDRRGTAFPKRPQTPGYPWCKKRWSCQTLRDCPAGLP